MLTRFVNLRIPCERDKVAPAEILVEDGTITAVDLAGRTRATDEDRVVDLGGHLVLPGVIDGHVHFDDPGFTHREDFATGTRAAAAGGVTCVVDMPCTSLPPVTSAANLATKLDAIAAKAHVDFMLWGGVSGNEMARQGWQDRLSELADAGIAAVKIYTLSGMDTFRDLDPSQVRQVLAEAHRLVIPVGVHAEDRDLVHELTTRIVADGGRGPLDYAASRPAAAEVRAVALLVELCRETGARVHVVHLASGEALDLVAAARAEGLPISAETCPHFLEFTDRDLKRLGAVLKTAPVVKAERDRARLWQGLAEGDIELVSTDHAAGQWPDEKHTGSIWTDYGGVPGVELLLPYLFSAGVGTGRITLHRLTELTAAAPARLFGIDHRKGRLAPGFDADLAVLEESQEWTVRAADLHNLNRYTPLEGCVLRGRVVATYVRGQCVFRRSGDGRAEFGPPGVGRFVKRGR